MPEGLRVSIIDPDDKNTIAQLGEGIRQALIEQGKGKGLAAASWIGTKAAESIDAAIAGIDLLDLFGRAWAAVKSLRERADPARYPQDQPQYVKLGQHTVEFAVTPALVVSIAGWDSKPIELAMTVSAELNAVELRIVGGHIVAMCGGSCDLGAAIALAGHEILPRRSLKTVRLDAEYRFRAPGIDLRSRENVASATDAQGSRDSS